MQPKCNVCGSILKALYPEVRDPVTGGIFAIERCPHCGLGHTVPQPDDLSPYYAAHYYGNRHGFTVRHCTGRRLRFVSAAITGGVGKRLLDIGCGDGSFLLGAREIGWEVLGTELNPGAARSAGLDVKCEIEEIGGRDIFDCVTMWHTLEHMRDPPATLANIRRLLKPDGRLIVAVPDFGSVQARIFGPKWLHADVPRHLYHFNKRSLRHTFAASEFAIRHTWYQEFEYDVLGCSQSALNYIQAQPNVFFDLMTGKPARTGKNTLVCGFILGVILTIASVPMVSLGALLKTGGTLIVVAERNLNAKVEREE